MFQLDYQIFYLINQTWTHPLLDLTMPIISDFRLWLPLIIPLFLYLIFGQQGKERKLTFLMLAAVAFSDPFSSRFLKKIFDRPRPCCVERNPRLLTGCKKSRAFPSSHAVNTSAVASVVFFEKGWKYGLPLLAISAVVSYSRVYLGVHYPLDVVGGMLIGIIIGFAASRIAEIILKSWPKKREI